MTEKELKQIGINKRKLAQLKSKYEDLCNSYGISAVQSDGMPHGMGGAQSGMSMVEDKVDIERDILRLRRENRELIERGCEYIKTIPDGYIKAVLSYRYIHCFDIVETAAVVRLSIWECEQICKVHFNNVL
mgnify:CR=1 FL=1